MVISEIEGLMRHKLKKSSHDSRTRDHGLHVYNLEPNKTGTIRGNKYVSGVVSGQWIRFMPWSIKFVKILANICKPAWIACRLIVGNKFSIRVGLKSGASNINTNHNVCTRRLFWWATPWYYSEGCLNNYWGLYRRNHNQKDVFLVVIEN